MVRRRFCNKLVCGLRYYAQARCKRTLNILPETLINNGDLEGIKGTHSQHRVYRRVIYRSIHLEYYVVVKYVMMHIIRYKYHL